MEVAALEATRAAIDIEVSADVGAVRRRALALAAAVGLDEVRAGDAALVATELASNVLKHAARGGAIVGCIGEPGARGVVITAWDRGPGMDLEACLRDGMSTAGTLGAGLGAVRRIASRFDAYTRPGRGSVVAAEVLPRGAPAPLIEVGAACVPYPGMRVCGDAWDAHIGRDGFTVIACDGLGHGEGAAVAAAAVVGAFRSAPDAELGEILTRADRAARATRGAAATLVRVDLPHRELRIAGVGNVAAWVAGDSLKQLVTQHGTLGLAMPHVREERYGFPPGAQLVLCSDGIRSRWSFDDYPGLVARAPTTISTVLWRELARGRDDATVVVVREARR
jgi:anti-sigma regulatory factor (Ser/Thr protein kinase)